MFFLHKFFPKTLLARFMLIIIIPTLIGQILVIFLFYDRHWYNVSYYSSNMIVNEIRLLIDNYKNKGLYTEAIEDYFNISYSINTNQILPQKQPRISEELQIFKNILNVKIDKKNIVRLNHEGKVEVLFQIDNDLIIFTFKSKLLINPTTYIFVLWLIALGVILSSISLIFSKNQIRSILELANAIDSFGRNQESFFYKPSGAKEIRKAGIVFLKMKERIEKNIARRTQMLAMISHDLRTPLTRMKLQLELMEDSKEHEYLKKDIDIMIKMIASYLDFARGEGGEEFEFINIVNWVNNLIKEKYANLDIDYNLPKADILVQIKEFSFQRAISNLIDNSAKYSTKIKISINYLKNQIEIIIEDNGQGVSDAEKPLIMKPFYRADKSRSINNNITSNVGLGLAITNEIIKNHSGFIILEDSGALGGLLVKVILPSRKI